MAKKSKLINFKKYLAVAVLLSATAAAAREPSTVIYNETKGETVLGYGLNIHRPIASLTKLMTAMVSLDYDNNLQRKIHMPGSVRLPKGSYSREELMNALLVRSDNGAAEAIALDYPGGRKGFILAMNKKAKEIGMVNTKFVDPSGLSPKNLSDVASVAIMMQVASLYPFIKESSIQKEVKVENRRFTIIMDNTNKPLLMDFDEIVLSKTGFTSASGWSVGLVVEKYDQRFSVVVLGAESKEQRYNLTKKIITNYFKDIEIEVEQKRNRTLFERIKDWWNDDE